MVEITRNLQRQVLSLTEDTAILGPCRLAKVTTNGFALTVSTPAHHGITIDGSKNPAAWGLNVVFTVPIYPQNDTHSLIVKAIDAVADDLRAKAFDKAGADGLAALEWFANYILVTNPGATQTQAQTAWATYAAANGVTVDGARWITWAINRLPGGYAKTWAGLKSFIASKVLDAWQGREVPTGEVIS